jgi:hypothetical protein
MLQFPIKEAEHELDEQNLYRTFWLMYLYSNSLMYLLLTS